MDKILESQIMTHKWHEFLYGYDTKERTKFLKGMEAHYPIVYGEDVSMGIYLEPYGIESSKKNIEHNNQDEAMRIDISAREYLKNLIAYHIMSSIESNSTVMGKVEFEIIKFLNSNYFGRKQKVSSVKDYLNELKDTLSICSETYHSILLTGNPHPKMFDFPSDFFDIGKFGKKVKNILNNNGQFNIIIDIIALESSKAIMSIINSRCAGTICMKVATDPEKWSTYYDLNGYYVADIHDYSTVELDDSHQKLLEKNMQHLDRIKNQFLKNYQCPLRVLKKCVKMVI